MERQRNRVCPSGQLRSSGGREGVYSKHLYACGLSSRASARRSGQRPVLSPQEKEPCGSSKDAVGRPAETVYLRQQIRQGREPRGSGRRPVLWRWAGSNRRPNKAPEGFLHAYPSFDCRGAAAGRRANGPLSSKSWRAVEESARASFLNDIPDTGDGRREPRRDTRRYGPCPRD